MSTSVVTSSNQRPMSGRTLAKGLGWFSIALGLGELLAPRKIRRGIGAPVRKELVQGYGLREIASGAMILMSRNPNQMVWSRVAGDLLDIATLAPTLHRDNPKRAMATGAMAFVLLATALDVYTAMMRPSDVRHGSARRR